ncbi:manganese/zinc/iron transport system permease protein [Arcanobacterium pluranimalium]|uniref:metal ABC transporter permease n=1 Tax=Arcanobacterium pluranimalium TaxID=108028 RepID=UPI00195BF4F8|nr:metal ABC transporter permease [Arcanobacterium pluranimalium]MBM7825705.1 manganese/zinc/iron transport system permease protein [Arcanobacterium pluranimalium]
MSVAISVLMLAIITSITCAVAGVFLVVRKQSMFADAMSHGMLPGIVLAAWIIGSIDSPGLIIGAAFMGMIIVFASEALRLTGLVNADATIGVFFPALFSLGVVMLSTVFSKIHLHEDAVLEGDLNIASITHLVIGDVDFGPVHFWVMLGVLIFDALCFVILWRALIVTTFDPQLAKLHGYPVRAVNYALMFVVSITITAAFKVAGAVLVVALLIVPAATARLLTRKMTSMMAMTVLISIIVAVVGFGISYQFDLATSAMMATVEGVTFLLVFFAMRIVWRQRRRSEYRRRRRESLTDGAYVAV